MAGLAGEVPGRRTTAADLRRLRALGGSARGRLVAAHRGRSPAPVLPPIIGRPGCLLVQCRRTTDRRMAGAPGEGAAEDEVGRAVSEGRRQRVLRMRPVSVRRLINAIRRLPSDPLRKDPRKWYLTQKQHWFGWLGEYNTRGAYVRVPGLNRDARYAYNHIVECRMRLWLIDAAGVDRKVYREARKAFAANSTLQRQAGAIRKVVPWDVVEAALWKSVTVVKPCRRSSR